jgi:hypothetical protein
MNVWIRGIALAMLATATVLWVSGCGGGTPSGKGPSGKDDHKGGGHGKDSAKKDDHKEHGSKDLKPATTFKEGVAQLEELHKKLHHQIEDNDLKHVPDTAKDIQKVANKTKELAQKDVAEDKLADAGRLCNEVAGYYEPMDKAADDGKKAETEAIHKKMGEAIAKLKGLSK